MIEFVGPGGYNVSVPILTGTVGTFPMASVSRSRTFMGPCLCADRVSIFLQFPLAISYGTFIVYYVRNFIVGCDDKCGLISARLTGTVS